MDYCKRISKLRCALVENRMDGIFISPDANWEYISGISRLVPGNTKHRQNSMEYCGLLITAEEIIAFIPRLTSLGIMDSIEGNPWLSKAVIFEDEDLTGKTFVNEFRLLRLSNKTIGVIQDVSSSVVLKLKDELDIKFINADSIIHDQRCIKDDEEIVLMKEASHITDKIFEKVLGQIKEGVTLREIEIEIDRLGEKFGASMTSFLTNVYQHGIKSGPTSSDSYKTIEKGHVMAFDFGIVYKGYCSDFGRTVFIGEPDSELVKLHKLVMSSQEVGINLLKPKYIKAKKVNEAARNVIKEAGYDKNFVHRLGHGIGMDVHERPFLAEGEERIIDTGMTFTVEPSIFVPKRCLIRVEDVVLVTENGAEVLNKITKDLIIVE